MQRYERELEIEEKSEEFKSQIFANNPDLYNDLYGEQGKLAQPDYLGEDEIAFPESEEEFKAMVNSMMRMGSMPTPAQQEGDQGPDRIEY